MDNSRNEDGFCVMLSFGNCVGRPLQCLTQPAVLSVYMRWLALASAFQGINSIYCPPRMPCSAFVSVNHPYTLRRLQAQHPARANMSSGCITADVPHGSLDSMAHMNCTREFRPGHMKESKRLAFVCQISRCFGLFCEKRHMENKKRKLSYE